MSDEVVLKVEGVSKKFCKSLKRAMVYGVEDIAKDLFHFRRTNDRLRQDEFWALDNVSFELRRGECLGIIGPNGAGKSTLLKMLSGIILPDKGVIEIHGRVGSLIELGAGSHPMLTGRENIYINGSILGLSKKEIDKKFDSIVDFAKLEDFIDTPVKFYSSGMYVRLGYAVAAHLTPEVMLVDEVLAVGDMAFKRKCQRHMKDYLSQGGVVVLVSHDMHLVQSMCSQCMLLDKGNIIFMGATTDSVSRYLEAQNSVSDHVGEKHAQLGDAPVVIERVDIYPSAGDEIFSGEQVELTLHYRSALDFEAVSWNFFIWTGDQQVLITAGRARFSNIQQRLSRETGQFRCTIPSLTLVPGTYALKAEILDLEAILPMARFGWENPPIYFEVKARGHELDNRRSITGDLVTMDVIWE
jgi:lipopolysaccharide transport system ATP-binding protein